MGKILVTKEQVLEADYIDAHNILGWAKRDVVILLDGEPVEHVVSACKSRGEVTVNRWKDGRPVVTGFKNNIRLVRDTLNGEVSWKFRDKDGFVEVE